MRVWRKAEGRGAPLSGYPCLPEVRCRCGGGWSTVYGRNSPPVRCRLVTGPLSSESEFQSQSSSPPPRPVRPWRAVRPPLRVVRWRFAATLWLVIGPAPPASAAAAAAAASKMSSLSESLLLLASFSSSRSRRRTISRSEMPTCWPSHASRAASAAFPVSAAFSLSSSAQAWSTHFL